jgi:predicted nuclease with TOPRIM domain
MHTDKMSGSMDIQPKGGIIMKNALKKERTGRTTHNSDSCTRTKVPSEEELAILNDMREIKARVKELKKRQSEISLRKGEYLEEKSRLEKEMKELKTEWNVLDEKGKRAAHDRMISLGYDKR